MSEREGAMRRRALEEARRLLWAQAAQQARLKDTEGAARSRAFAEEVETLLTELTEHTATESTTEGTPTDEG